VPRRPRALRVPALAGRTSHGGGAALAHSEESQAAGDKTFARWLLPLDEIGGGVSYLLLPPIWREQTLEMQNA